MQRSKKENCLIFEDSPVGLLSAQRSGARYYKVNTTKQINLANVKRQINSIKIKKFISKYFNNFDNSLELTTNYLLRMH